MVMTQIPVRFVIGEITEDEVTSLCEGNEIISKMSMSHEDFKIFVYREGHEIEVETEHGNRIWCRITNLEIINKQDGVLVIFTLIKLSH